MIETHSNSNELIEKFKVLDFNEVAKLIKIQGDDINYSKSIVNPLIDRDDIIFVDRIDNEIRGILVLGYNEEGWSFNPEHKFACKFVSVKNAHTGIGIATGLISAMFCFASMYGIKVIRQSTYDSKFIKKTFDKISLNFKDVELYDKHHTNLFN